jgi:glycosyltransferase involved in cell wall biosynthesis
VLPEPKSPTISVIIPAFNADKTLGRAVASLAATGEDSLQIIIVDDGSTDQTWQESLSLCGQYPGLQLECFQHSDGKNRGVSASRNLGIQHATGECIAFLDGDDTVAPNRFTTAVEILKKCPEVDAVYETTEIIVEDESQSSDWLANEIFGIQEPLVGTPLWRSLLHGIPWHTSAVVMRRSLLQKTGLFAEDLTIAEDCHLWMRMVAVGTVVPGQFKSPVSYYRRQAGSLYQPGLSRKLDYFVALSRFYCWLKTVETSAELPKYVRTEFIKWIDNAMIQFRAAGRGDLVRSLASMTLTRHPSLFFQRRFLSHVVRSTLRVSH